MSQTPPVDFSSAPHNGIVDFAGQRAARLRLHALTAVEAYWEALRGLSRVSTGLATLPRRSDIDPRGIENSLAHAFIAEQIAPGMARLRVAGSALTDILGAEARGLPLSVPIAPGERAAFQTLLEQVFVTPALVEVALVSPRRMFQPALHGRMLLLPLLGVDGRVNSALGAFEVEGAPGRGSRRFSFQTLRCCAVQLPDTHPIYPPGANIPATLAPRASQDPPQQPSPTSSSPRPYLRLVKTD